MYFFMEVVSLLTSSISINNCLYIIIHVDYVALRDQYIGDRSLYETDSVDIITEISCDRYANDANDCSYNIASYYHQQAVLTCISGKLLYTYKPRFKILSNNFITYM